MGFFDDAANTSVPGGNLSKPIMIALAALFAAKMFGGSRSQPAPAGAAPQAGADDGGLLGGLGGLVDKLRSGGHGSTVDSWIGTGQNQPIQPKELNSALGQQTIGDLARKAGVSEQELLQQLSAVLPGLVDKLTPQGRMPTPQEASRWNR